MISTELFHAVTTYANVRTFPSTCMFHSHRLPWQSVLVVAGAFKRAEPDLAEDALLMRALRDFNIPKIVREDEVVFFGLLGKILRTKIRVVETSLYLTMVLI